MKVIAFTGHMTDQPGRTPPRFPVSKVEPVRRAIQQKLMILNVQDGFCSAARGSDLLFIEEMLKRSGKVHVFLPFPKADFAHTSVGYGWDDRYNTVLGNTNVEVKELKSERPTNIDQEKAAYAACNDKIFEAAIAHAKHVGQEPILLAILNRSAGGDKGGTLHAVRRWKSQGNSVEVIDISNL